MRFVQFLVSVLFTSLLLWGCSKDETTTGNPTVGTVKVHLTDGPGDFEKVNITFSEITANLKTGEENWIVINNQSQTLDLLTLTNGITSVLGEKQLDPGQYGQIRLKITKAEVVVKGTTYTLDVPSGATSGLKLGSGFTILPGITTELVVDFDAARSIHAMGNKQNYKLNPVLRLIVKAESGAVSGKVVNYQNSPLAYAIAGTDTVASALVKKDSGGFLLGFLPAGSYTVAVADTLNKKFSRADVMVTVGNTTNLGDITLQ
ncbi:MAG: DUF4382 domain-containing protein [Candidatus Latescibacter sp.]|nr:DUF4382 domain-containing protein [Candidatus Latescibacter sp.]